MYTQVDNFEKLCAGNFWSYIPCKVKWTEVMSAPLRFPLKLN